MGELIGLSGRAGAGKDTVCGFIREWGDERGYTVKREAFADRLKLSVARLFFPQIELEEAVSWCNALKEHGRIGVEIPGDGDFALSGDMTGRVFLQRYGTEAHRDVFYKDFWVEAALQDLSADFTIITDPRFQNEADAIHREGGELWRIVRPGEEIASNAHISENGFDDSDIDLVLPNCGSLDELRAGAYQAMDDCLNYRSGIA